MDSRPSSLGRKGRQRGAATLIMVLAVLVLLTVITVMSGRIATVEQRTAASELRARQALEAAMTGFELALAHANDPANVPLDAAPDRNPRAVAPDGRSTFAVEFCDATILSSGLLQYRMPSDPTDRCTVPAADSRLRIVYARGWSDDGTGIHHVVSLVERAPAFAGAPQNPLTAHGSVIIDGSGDVVNPYGRSTIWSGHQAIFSNANFKTSILSPTGDGIIESSSSRQAGVDVVDSDSRLARVSGDIFFENFMGFPPGVYVPAVGATVIADLGDGAGEPSYNKVLWAADPNPADATTHTFDTSSNSEFGYAGDGSAEDPNGPVVMIVEGNLDVAGTVTVNGLLYVRGNLTGSGNLTVRGAVIVQGSVSGMTGSVDVIYDPLMLGQARGLGRAAALPGSWKDWLQTTDTT